VLKAVSVLRHEPLISLLVEHNLENMVMILTDRALYTHWVTPTRLPTIWTGTDKRLELDEIASIEVEKKDTKCFATAGVCCLALRMHWFRGHVLFAITRSVRLENVLRVKEPLLVITMNRGQPIDSRNTTRDVFAVPCLENARVLYWVAVKFSLMHLLC
jgi:hypothetical protein